MTSSPDWLARRTAEAPPALRGRVREHLACSPAGEDMAERLLAAGDAALGAALVAPGDRAAALDLLSADALITLALVARAEAEPEALEAFARKALRQASAGA